VLTLGEHRLDRIDGCGEALPLERRKRASEGRNGRPCRIPPGADHLVHLRRARLGDDGVADNRVDEGNMPIGKWFARAREDPVCEFVQDLPARMVPRVAGQLGAPQIRWGVQQLYERRPKVVIRGERLGIEMEAFLQVTLLQMHKREVPVQMAVQEPVPWIVRQPGAKKGDSGAKLVVLVVEMCESACTAEALRGYWVIDRSIRGWAAA
jgi:hypothetical protein